MDTLKNEIKLMRKVFGSDGYVHKISTRNIPDLGTSTVSVYKNHTVSESLLKEYLKGDTSAKEEMYNIIRENRQ